MKWEKVKLGDIVDIKKGQYITKKDSKEGPYPVILGGREPAYYIDKYNHIGKAIVVSRSGASAGYVSFWNEPIFITDGFLIEPKEEVDIDFLYYLMKSKEGQFIGNQGGSAIPHVTPRTINIFSVYIPNIKIQKKIASILSAYDDLIENNQKQIKLLEEAAQRLYKEWFVDLRFPGHESVKVVDGVPEGWKKTRLDEVIEFNPKVSLAKERIKEFVPMSALSNTAMILDTNEITYTQSNSGSKFKNDDTIMARITPCLENGKIAFVQELKSEEGAVGSTEYIVLRSRSLCPSMVYLLSRTQEFRKYAINNMSGSDGRQRVKVERLREYEYLKPTNDLVCEFSSKVTPMFKNIKHLSKLNAILREARDRLLPKLMSGEIEVEDTSPTEVVN